MTYEIREPLQINNNNIKLGKSFKYSLSDNYYLTNIYYINDEKTNNDTNNTNDTNDTNKPIIKNIIKEKIDKKQDSIDDKTKLIIQTPLMYIPNSIIYFNEKPFLELSFNNEDNDKDVNEFKTWITKLEDYIFKLIKKRSILNIKKENMVSILKQKNNNYVNSSNKILVPINMNISKCILNDGFKKSKFLFDWKIPVPTYGISIIWVKNIWVKNEKWGLNLFMYASRVMNSHILDPIDFLGLDGNNKSIKTYEVNNKFKTNEKFSIIIGEMPDYIMYFKMLKIGIPKEAIKQKIALNGLDIRIIDYPETTPYATVLHYISNPQLKYVKPSNSIHEHIQDPIQNPIDNPSQNQQSTLKLDLLKNIGIGGFKLKSIKDNNDESDNRKKEKQNNMKQTIMKQNNNKLRVPTLNDIQGALSKLKKVDLDFSNESNL